MAYKIPQPIAQLPGGQGLPNLPSLAFNDPNEGRRYIPVEIDWDGSGTTYQLNVAGLTTQPFSQVVMLDVDNTKSGADVTFYFPDSMDSLVVPAESAGLFPVFTGGLLMYVSAASALSTDVTRFRILNYRQDPIANPPPEFSQTATAFNITANGTTHVIVSGVSGTLTGYSANVALFNGSGSEQTFTLEIVDHATSSIIDRADVSVPSGAVNLQLMNVSGIAVRFGGGIDVVVAGTLAGSGGGSSIVANVTVRYRTP